MGHCTPAPAVRVLLPGTSLLLPSTGTALCCFHWSASEVALRCRPPPTHLANSVSSRSSASYFCSTAASLACLRLYRASSRSTAAAVMRTCGSGVRWFNAIRD